jgi:surfeit locus 1 family protein
VTIVNKSSRSRASSLLAVGVALVLAMVGVALGVWQLNRAEEKRHLTELRETRTNSTALGQSSSGAKPQGMTAMAWSNSLAPSDLDQQRVLLKGTWIHERSIALDNRAWEGRPGVHVLTPLRLPDDSLIWVNRGWMPKAPGAGPAPKMPAAVNPQELEGVALASVMRRVELSSSPEQLRQGRAACLWMV